MVIISTSTNDAARLSESSTEALRLGYELIKFTDEKQVQYTTFSMKLQKTGDGSIHFPSWQWKQGFDHRGTRPVDDLNTGGIGITVSAESKAKASFLMAGTHRQANRDRSSDAVHSPRNIFQVVHETITKNPGYPQIVLSPGDGASTSPVSELSSILWAKNFTAMIANGGTLNEFDRCTHSAVIDTAPNLMTYQF